MRDLAEGGDRRGADTIGRALGELQIREARFKRLVAAAQGVVLAVADLGSVVLIVERIVAGDFGREALEFGFGR